MMGFPLGARNNRVTAPGYRRTVMRACPVLDAGARGCRPCGTQRLLSRTISCVKILTKYFANHVNGPSFAQSLKGLNQKHTYLVYCQSGSRSSRAAGIMKAGGLNVLDGGGLRSMQSKGWTLGA